MNEALKMLVVKLAEGGRTELALGLAVGYAAAEDEFTGESNDKTELARMIAAISLVKIKQDTLLNDDVLHQVGLTQADLQAAVKTLGAGANHG